jgi:DNA-binding NtrC family response regulator
LRGSSFRRCASAAATFWAQLGGNPRGIDAAVIARWEKHTWPGNVRELRNAVARQIALGDLEIAADDASPPHDGAGDFIDAVVSSRVPLVRGRSTVVDEYERRYIERVLADHGGNVVHAARASGIARRHFQRLHARTRKP